MGSGTSAVAALAGLVCGPTSSLDAVHNSRIPQPPRFNDITQQQPAPSSPRQGGRMLRAWVSPSPANYSAAAPATSAKAAVKPSAEREKDGKE